MAPATYVAEYCLIWDQWERRPWSCGISMPQHRGMLGGNGGWGELPHRSSGEGRWDRGFAEEKMGKGRTFEMQTNKISNLKKLLYLGKTKAWKNLSNFV